jgi:hypothetical protein
MEVDILDLLLDEETPSPVKKETVDEVEADIDLLLEEFSTGDAEAKKASLRALVSMLKR